MKKYDIVILGGGAAGLSCAVELASSGKSILILEKVTKASNDRTWSYWENGAGKYDHILSNRWNKLSFYGNQNKEAQTIAPYQYKMLRSSDFYYEIHSKLNNFDNVTYINDEILNLQEKKDEVIIKGKDNAYCGALVLDGIFIPRINNSKHFYVAQHFGGWFIETQEDAFDPDNATFMDFRIPQENDTRFFYVLPISSRSALVEIAIFSNHVEQMDFYDHHIEKYINTFMQLGEYSIIEKEKGVIPMTSYPFDTHNTSKVIKIGTAGGWVKPSSGYAFKRIMDRSETLAHQIINQRKIDVSSKHLYKWLDKIMLKAILRDHVSGKQTFSTLFKNRSFQEIFKFLDEENSLSEDVKCMLSAPILPFTKAALLP